MKRPAFLKKGDTLGVTAPSAGVSEFADTVRFGNAARRMSGRGYGVRFTPDVFTDTEGRSAPAEQRAAELESLFLDDSVTAVFSAKGGDFLNEILPYIDRDVLRDHPKWFQGYSDNTDICLMLTLECGIVSSYAGQFGDFGMSPWHRSVTENIEILEGTRCEQSSYDMYESAYGERLTGTETIVGDTPVRWVSDGDVSMEGTLIGGCSDKLAMIPGTDRDCVSRFCGECDGVIWYMETYESGRADLVESLRRMESAGWFSGTAGFLFGRPLFYEGGADAYATDVRNALGHLEVPMIFDADVGHRAPRMTMLNGAEARIECHDGEGTLRYV